MRMAVKYCWQVALDVLCLPKGAFTFIFVIDIVTDANVTNLVE